MILFQFLSQKSGYFHVGSSTKILYALPVFSTCLTHHNFLYFATVTVLDNLHELEMHE